MTAAQGLSDEELEAAIARRRQPANQPARPPQRPPSRARHLSDEDLQREIERQQNVQRRRPQIDAQVQRQARARAVLPLMGPFGLATGVMTNAFEPHRMRARNESARGFADDVRGFFDQTPEEAWSQVRRGFGRGIAAVPGAVGEMVTHPGETLWSMTGEPFVRGEQQAQALDRANLEGDEDAAMTAAHGANTAQVDQALNVGGFALGGQGAFGRQVAGRAARTGLGGFARQTAENAALGSAIGGTIGAVRTPGDLEERVAGATEGAGVGATIGAVAPTAINTVRGGAWAANNAPRMLGAPAVTEMLGSTASAASRLIDDMSRPDPNSVGAFGRPPQRRAPPQRGEPAIPQEERIAQMFERARVGADDLEAQAAAARDNPQGQAVVDLAGDTGVRTLRPVVQSPGETGARAQEFTGERFGNAPGIIARNAREGLGVTETPHQATLRLDGDYRRLSAEAYEPHWREQMTPRQLELFDERLAPLLDPNNPNVPLRNVMQDAVARAEQQFGLDRAEGIVSGGIHDNLPRFLHYIKGALGEVAQFEASPLRGASGRRVASLRSIYRRFGDAMDPLNGEAIVPGYRQTTSRAGDNFAAREAMEAGEQWINMTGEEVAHARSSMTPFELEHARISLAENIRRTSRGNVTGQRNVANGILNDPDAQAAIAAAFDSPEQAARFIETVNTQNQLMRNSSQWGGGAQTYSNAAFGIDGAMHAVRAIHNPIEGGLMAVAKWLDEAGVERANNQFGEAALRRVDTSESKVFVRRLARILRRRATERATAEAAARAATVTARPPQNGERAR